MINPKDASIIVNSFAKNIVNVGGMLGLNMFLNKDSIKTNAVTTDARIAATVGFHTPSISGSASILLNQPAFHTTVFTMSGGMVGGDVESNIACSAIAEFSNMVCGNASSDIMNNGLESCDIVPPQVVVGDNIRPGMKSDGESMFTLPFSIQDQEGIIYVLLHIKENRKKKSV